MFFNPIRPVPVPQRHYPPKIDCQILMNELNGLSFYDFLSWTLFYPPKESNFQYLNKSFEKLHSKHIWLGSLLSQIFDIEPRFWARTLIFCMWPWICSLWRPTSLDLVILKLKGWKEGMLSHWKALYSKYGIWCLYQG